MTLSNGIELVDFLTNCPKVWLDHAPYPDTSD